MFGVPAESSVEQSRYPDERKGPANCVKELEHPEAIIRIGSNQVSTLKNCFKFLSKTLFLTDSNLNWIYLMIIVLDSRKPSVLLLVTMSS